MQLRVNLDYIKLTKLYALLLDNLELDDCMTYSKARQRWYEGAASHFQLPLKMKYGFSKTVFHTVTSIHLTDTSLLPQKISNIYQGLDSSTRNYFMFKQV